MTRKEDGMRVRASVLAVASALCTLGAAAQTTAQAPATSERIEVTGSNIKRVEGETALPVTVISREEIARTGATSAYELMSFVAANNSLGNVSAGSVIGTTSFSAQTASLRGLGGGRTLVLINGKRVNGFAGEINGVQGVNLSVIPITAVERIEVLKDGASAVYGSDAIAGVINFILRSDYRGGEATAYYGAPTRSGGGKEERYSGALGFGDLDRDRFNVFFALEYDRQHHLDQVDRNFSNTSVRPDIGLIGTSSNTFPGRISTGGIGVPGAPNCAPSVFVDVPAVGLHGCFYDPAADPGVQSIPDTTTKHAFASGKVKLTPSWQLYGHALYAEDENRFVIQPVPISSVIFYGPSADIPMTITLQPTSPFYPHALAAAAGVDGKPLDVRYRAYENGQRDTTDKNKGGQVVGGINGSIGKWDTDLSYTYSQGKVSESLNNGFPLASRILPLLNSGNVNLFGYNTPAVQQQLLAANFYGQTFSGKSTSEGLQARASTELWQLPAGPLAVAFGAEERREKLEESAAAALATGDITGYGGNIVNVTGTRNITAFYGEANVPIVRNLEANVALRTDRYSDFGRTNNPKVSLRWQPSRDLLVRSSYGTGFLAPSLYQLYNPQLGGVSQSGVSDPIRCPVTNDQGLDCITQFPVTLGGNPQLRPETSEQVTAGVVLEPSSAWSVSADYFKIRLSSTITTGVPVSTILGDLSQYGGYVTRGPVQPQYPNLPGPITNIVQTFVNLGDTHIEGVDLEAHYRWPRQGWGRLRFDLSGTYYIRYDVQATDGSYGGIVSNSFNSPVTGVVPRWKHYASFTWDRGPWTASVANTFQSAYVDVNTDLNGNLREVGSMSLYDVQGSYSGFRHLTLTLGVKNVLDANPPKTNQRIYFQAGYDPSYYDARARFVYGSLTYSFK